VTAGIGDARTFLFAACPGAVPAVMVPKAEDPTRLAALSLTLPAGTGIIPLADGVTTDLTDESARGVIAAGQDGAVGVRNSQMIDRPVVLRAEAILARAARTGAARTGARTGQEG
jgi:citrate lyase beta subunit